MDVAIIGGGLGGLTLACVLHRQGIGAIVYERDPGPESRGQGGSLDLHPAVWSACVGSSGPGRPVCHDRASGGAATPDS